MNRRDVMLLSLAAPLALHAAQAFSAAGPKITVYKSDSCGCCKLWVTHLEKAGFAVTVVTENNLAPVKERVGVPYGKGSCHTGEVEGYFVEGHAYLLLVVIRSALL